MKCSMCGRNELSTGDFEMVCPECKRKLDENNHKIPQYIPYPSGYGIPWICPKCGSIYGPGVFECYRCNEHYVPSINCTVNTASLTKENMGSTVTMLAEELANQLRLGRVSLT